MDIDNKEHIFLADGGEMGELIRTKDWSKTPLGNPSTWPASLKTMVSVMLNNPFGMYIAWGKEFTQIYNDGYRPILGASKHPDALGISSKETFSEVWHIIGPMFQGVMEGQAVGFPDFMLPLERNGYVETCFFDFAYSPIKLETGEVGGILVTVIETTNKKKAEDDLKANKSELEFVIDAAQLATFDYNPLTHKFTGNERLKEWFGLTNEQEIDLEQALSVVIHKDKKRVSKAIKSVLEYESGGKFDIEYTIYNQLTKKNTIVHAKGRTWFNEDKIAYRLNGTLEDVTSRVLARQKIEESERSLKLMIMKAPIAISIIRGEDYKVEIANKYALELWGRTEKEVLNISIFDSMPEISTQGIKEILDEVVKTGNRFSTSEMPVQLMRDGILETVYINFSYDALHNAEGNVNGVMAIGYDINEQVQSRKKVEESEQNIRALVESAPFPIGVYAGEELKITLANQSIIDAWGKGNDVIGKLYTEVLPELKNQNIYEQIREVLHTGVPFHAKNQRVDIEKNGELKSYYFNYSFTPVRDASGNIHSVMNTAADVTELHEAKQLVEVALSEIKLFKFMVETAADPFILMEEDGSFNYLNRSALEKWGYSKQEMRFLKVPDVDIIYNEKKYRQAFEKAKNEILPPFETLHKNKNGQIYPVEINMGGIQIDDKYFLFAVARDITERKKAEKDIVDAFKKVEEIEKRFRDAVKQAPFAISIFRGPNHITEMANESYLRLIDKSEQQFIGKPFFEVLPEVEATIEPIIADIYKTGTAFYGHEFLVNLKRQGKLETGYYNFVYHPLKENNNITGIMIVGAEVTEIVKAKNTLQENEEKLNLIINASELGIFDVNLKLGGIVANDRCYKIMGLSSKEKVSHKDLIAQIHPNDLATRNEAYEKAIISGSFHYQSRIIHNNRSVHWIDLKGKVFYDDENKPEKLLGTIRDITEEKTFQNQLQEREEKFRLLANSMPQHIWTSDPNGNINYFNQSVYEYSGLTAQELKEFGWLKIIHPDERDENVKHWTEAIRTGKDFLFEHRFRKHTGEYRWQLSRAKPQKDSNGNIKMWVGTSTDIQEQKMFTSKLENMVLQRTKELQHKNVELEKMNKELQSFVYISSHDLQEPLRKIQIFASRILESENATLSQNATKYFTKMQISASRMQRLIQDLLAYSRTNVQENTFETIDLQEIIEDVKETLSEELEQNKVTFKLLNICEVKIIAVQFKQVLHNLISNSIKFARTEHPIVIEIGCETVLGKETDIEALIENQTYSHIRFSDNGIGFEPQYSERIFEVFQRLHSKEEYAGTGIGLAIVKKIIENHHGIILATSSENEGAIFNIYIPA